MIALEMYPRAEEMMHDVPKGTPIVEVPGRLKVGCLGHGTVNGNPTVSFFFQLPDGSWAFAETTLVLLLTVADSFKALHGDPRR